jgi:hypothetical protein
VRQEDIVYTHRGLLAIAVLALLACADTGTAPGDAPLFQAGKGRHSGNYALAFSMSFVEVPDAAVLDLAATFTIEAWIKPRTVTSYQHIVSKWNSAGNSSYTMEVHDGKLRSAIHDGVNESQGIESNGTIVPDVWQHVAVTLDNGTLRLYINGVLDREFTGSQTPMNSDRPVSVGHEGPPYNGWWYDGLIDDVRLWNVTRTDAQIAASMNRLKGKSAGLVGWWRFDEGQGDVAKDATKNRNNGRLGSAVGADANDPSWVTDVP